MRTNVDLLVRRLHGAYCVQLTRPMDGARLYWADRPYGEPGEDLGPMDGTERWAPAPEDGRRMYFCARDAAGACVWAADRAVEIEGIENFRDMGGYRAAGGRTVKWGRFLRSGPIAGMDEAALAAYRAMGIRSIFDYRATGEAARQPDFYEGKTRYFLVPGIREDGETAQRMQDMDMETRLADIRTAQDADRIFGMFQGLYEALPFGNEAYRAMLSSLDDEAMLPMIQHCSAGKDRTGVGCALLLLSLGVDEGTVMEDYLLSAIFRQGVNRAFARQMAGRGVSGHALALMERMMTVTPDLLGSSFAAIKRRYGDIDTFLAEEYGATAERRAQWVRMHTV